MDTFAKIIGELHRIKVKLYPNYLVNTEGKYIARTNNEKTLSIEQVCAALKSRGGYTGDYNDIIDKVNRFFAEAAYQLCDGFAVNTGYFSIHPNIGGTFNSVSDSHDKRKNPITFRYRTGSMLQNLVEHIAIEIEGLADVNGYIDEFYNFDKDAVNSIFSPDDGFSISGHKIKIAGDNHECGVYFVPVDDPAGAVKVERIFENNPSKITGLAPKTSSNVQHRIEVRTQYAGSGSYHLKTPRIITSSFAIEQSIA